MMRRFVGFSLFLGAIAALTLRPSGEIVHAADTKLDMQLKKEIADLKNQLKAANDAGAALQQQVAAQNATIANLKAQPGAAAAAATTQLNKANTDLAAAKKSLATIKNAPFVHTVVLTMKKDAPDTELQKMLDDLPGLNKIKTVRGLWFGAPPSTTSDAAKFSVAITVLFDDASGLKTYFDDKIHKDFANKHLKFWETPVVYDYVTPTPLMP